MYYFLLQFRTLLLTMECLFSLLNGDDMYPTFTNVSTRSGTAVQIFSKLYLYGFISFFIYVVLSTFISIVGDTYERLKVCLKIANISSLVTFVISFDFVSKELISPSMLCWHLMISTQSEIKFRLSKNYEATKFNCQKHFFQSLLNTF